MIPSRKRTQKRAKGTGQSAEQLKPVIGRMGLTKHTHKGQRKTRIMRLQKSRDKNSIKGVISMENSSKICSEMWPE